MGTVTPIPAATGSEVAIIGTTNDWDGTSSENFVSLTNAWLAQGGIVLVSQAPQNPLKVSGGTYADVRTPGTAAYIQWHKYLDTQIAKFKQINGAVIWRPFIELNKNWSWWVSNQNPADFKIIWQQMHDYFAANGVNNVVWLFNVNTSDTTAGVTSWYPGSTYVDIVSIDAYPPTTSQDTPVYNALVATGKPIMYAETGVHSPDNASVAQHTYDSSTILATIKANFPKVFAVVVWCQNYALPLQNGESAFMSDPAIITLSDVPAGLLK
jgi:beta-mannanase